MYEDECQIISKFDSAYKVVSLARPCPPTGQPQYPNPDAEPQQFLSQACVKAFKHWTVYLRASAKCFYQEVRIVCPLCREPFSHIEVFLHHISQNGWYWCPFHNCPERAFPIQTETKLNSQFHPGGKESKMKGAVSFFKNFGRRQIHKCCRSKMEDPSLLLSTDKVYELEDNDIGFELEDNDKGFELEDDSKTEQFDVDSKYVDCSKLRDSIDKIGEMEDNSRNKARDIDASLMLSPSSPKACEIDGNELPPRKRRGSLVREAHQSDHISLPGRPDREVVLELSAPGRALENHKLPSFRTSEAGSNLSISNVDKTTNTSAVKHASIFEPIIATLPSSQDVEPDELKHTMADLEFYPIHTGYGFNSVGQAWTLRTPEALVKDTQEQARSLNNAWAKKLTSMPQFRHLKSRLYRTSVFESGLHSLGMCLEGRIPSSFEGVFSMMHVVLSFAYILYSHESMTFPWDALFEDIFRWRYAITNEADSILYSEVAHAIWPSVTSMKTMALYKSLDIIESSSPDSNIQENKKRRAVYFHEPPFCACQTQPLSSLEHQKSHLKDLLSKGNVIKLCTRYLDEFANSNINERCPITPLWDIKAKQQSLQEIKADVIDPLLRQKVPEPFRGDLNDVDSKVSRGLLTNVREVEARLISNGRLHQTGWEVYERYVEVVMRACDKAMSTETEWRAGFYRFQLFHIHAIVIESENQKHRGVHIVNQMQHCGRKDLPVKGRTASAQKPLEADFEAGFKTPEHDPPDQISPSSGTTSQDTNSDNSIQLASTETSPMSIVAQDSFDAFSKLECPECEKSFHGDSRVSNLRRHRRNLHGSNVLIECPVPGCKKQRGRRDNMHKHLRTDHANAWKLPPLTRIGKQRTRRS